MLLLAHLSREDIPAPLQKDLHFVLTKGLPLLQEMLGIATVPRMQVRICRVAHFALGVFCLLRPG
jgi:hypothetical protein